MRLRIYGAMLIGLVSGLGSTLFFGSPGGFVFLSGSIVVYALLSRRTLQT